MQKTSDSTPPIALTIAGSDSGGGAGIQADLKAFHARGVHGLSAIAAITSQNTRGVSAVHAVPLAHIRSQLDAVFDDFAIDAVKTGMLGHAAIVRLVAREHMDDADVREDVVRRGDFGGHAFSLCGCSSA